jgi:hypothetical protein
MARTTRAIAVLALALVFAAQTPATAQNVPRLIADNRTPYVVDLYAWNGAAWGFVSRLGPRTWQQFPNALQGSVWRAHFGSAVREHRVNYTWYPDYNGYQDIWLIQ